MSFWRSETLHQRAPQLVAPFTASRIQQGAYELALGDEAFVSGSGGKTAIPVGGEVVIPAGQTALLLTEETIQVPADAIAFISIKSEKKLRGLINVSGFHVDPGFCGKLVFSVFNAGVQEIHLNRGVPLFMIWYAALDQTTTDVYHGSHQNQTQIPDGVITNVASKHPSPPALKEEIDGMKKDVLTLRNTTWALIALAFTTAFGSFLSGVLKPPTTTPQVLINAGAVTPTPSSPTPSTTSSPSASAAELSASPQATTTAIPARALSPTPMPTPVAEPSKR